MWDQVFTMTSVTDEIQLCVLGFAADAECQCRGHRCWRSRGGAVIAQITPKPCCTGCRSGTASGIRPLCRRSLPRPHITEAAVRGVRYATQSMDAAHCRPIKVAT